MQALVGAVMLVLLLPVVVAERVRTSLCWLIGCHRRHAPRLFFGATPIHALETLASALRDAGFVATSGAVADAGAPVPGNFNIAVNASAKSSSIARAMLGYPEAMLAFVRAVFAADIFHLYFDGGLLRRTPLQALELWLLRLAGKRIIMFSYGSDAFVIPRIPYQPWREVLAADYPALVEKAGSIAARVDRFSRQATLVVGSLVHKVGLPRCDALMLTCYPVETDQLTAKPLVPGPRTLRILHAPNHRTIKGTAHLIAAVERLTAQGHAITLDIVERVPRSEVLRRMAEADVVVDQLIFGYGLTALEGLALGRIVISGRNPDDHMEPFRHLAGFELCPVIWSSPEGIESDLRNLTEHPLDWPGLGMAGRAYVEKCHSKAATARSWASLYPSAGWPVRPVRAA